MKKYALILLIAGLCTLGCYAKREDKSDPNDKNAPKMPTNTKPPAGGGAPGMPGGGGPGMPGGGMPKAPGK